MAAPLYSSSAPLFEAGGVSGSTPIAGQGGASPAATIKPSGQTINVIDPASGETYGLDAAYVPDALAKGFKVETAEHAGIRKYVDENKGISGDAKVFFRGLLDEATFGAADPLIDATRDPYELAKWGALKANHPGSNIAGRGAGIVGSMFYGGEVFGPVSKAGGTAAKLLGRTAVDAVEHGAARALAAEAAYRAPGIAAHEASKIGSGAAAKILQSAADLGTQGLVLSSPKAMAQLITGDPERAAETWIYGAAGGAALGAAAGGIGHMFSGTASKMLPAGEGAAVGGMKGAAVDKLRTFGDDQAISALNLTQKYTTRIKNIKNGASEAATIVRENDLARVAGDAPAMLDAVDGLRKETGTALSSLYANAGDKAMTSIDEIGGAARKVLLPETGPKMGQVGASETVEKWFNTEIFGPSVSIAEKNGGKLTLSELHDVRVALDKATRWDSTVSNEVNELRKDLRSAVTDLIESKLDAAGHSVPELQALNKRYSVLRVMADGAEHNTVRAMSNRKHSLTDYLGNTIGGTIGGFVGGGVGSVVGGLVGGEANNVLRRWGPGYISKGAHAAADWLEGRGLVALEEAHATHAAQLDHIPTALAAMSAGKIVPRTPIRDTIGVNVLTRFLGIDPADKLDSDKRLMALADNLASLSTDPARISERAQEAIAPIVGDAPDVGVAATTKLTGIVSYLAGVAPKAPSQASPFEPPTQWKPNAAQMAEFRTRVKVALDPYAAIDALNNGTLTKPHVETLMTVSPRLYEEMIKRVTDFASSGNAKPMPYAQRLRLSLLTGAPLDRSIAQIAGYQQAFTAPAQSKAKAPNIKPPEVSAVERLSAG